MTGLRQHRDGENAAAGGTGRGRNNLATCGTNDGFQSRRCADERQLSQPRQRAHHLAQPADGDVEKRPDHVGVELTTGAAGELGAGRGGTHRAGVRARRSHDLVRIGDRNDASTE